MYLLDTCIISELVKERPNQSVMSFIESTDESNFYLSVLTLGEIHKGVSALSARKASPQRVAFLRQWVQYDLEKRFEGRILAVDSPTASLWGAVMGKLAASQQKIHSIDGLILATAYQHHLTLVTRNEKDFLDQTVVSVLNPFK